MVLSYWLNMQRAWLEQSQRFAAAMPVPLMPGVPPTVASARSGAVSLASSPAPAKPSASVEDASVEAAAAAPKAISGSDIPLLPEQGAAAGETQQVMHLLAEDLEVDRRQVEAGRVQIRRVTRTESREIDEELARLDAEVEHVAIGVEVESVPPVRETEDRIIIPVVEEIVVVERRLMLREEIHVHKRHSSARHQEQVLLRIQEALITRLPPQADAAGRNG